jgi:hypothetical protein
MLLLILQIRSKELILIYVIGTAKLMCERAAVLKSLFFTLFEAHKLFL